MECIYSINNNCLFDYFSFRILKWFSVCCLAELFQCEDECVQRVIGKHPRADADVLKGHRVLPAGLVTTFRSPGPGNKRMKYAQNETILKIPSFQRAYLLASLLRLVRPTLVRPCSD